MAQAFLRAKMMMTAIAAAMAEGMSLVQAGQVVGPYVSRGKRKTASHDGGGTRAFQRAAMKRRNRAKNRRAHRG